MSIVWKFQGLRRKLLHMRSVGWFGMFVFVLFLEAVQSGSSKLETPVTIQNRDTVQQLYGKPQSEVYRTSQGLRITASFAPNGSLCQAHIGSGLDARITDRELNGVLDELAPENVRGKHKLSTFLNITCIKLVRREDSTAHSSGGPSTELAVDPCSECSGVSDDYERVNITKYGNTNQYSSVHLTFQQPECKELEEKHR